MEDSIDPGGSDKARTKEDHTGQEMAGWRDQSGESDSSLDSLFFSTPKAFSQKKGRRTGGSVEKAVVKAGALPLTIGKGTPEKGIAPDGAEAFKRKPLLHRSPLSRSGSDPILATTEGVTGPAVKRKRSDRDEQEPISNEEGDDPLKILVDKVKELVKATLTRKGDLPLDIEELILDVGQQSKAAWNARENGKTRSDASVQTLSLRSLKEVNEQVEIMKLLEEADTEDKVQALVNRNWPQTTFQVTKTEKRSLLKAEGTKVLLIDLMDEIARGKIAGLITQYPALRDILEKKIAAGTIATIKREDVLMIDNVEVPTSTGGKMLVGSIKKGEEGIATSLEVLKKVRHMRAEDERITIAGYGLLKGSLRKLAEYVFKDGEPIHVCEEKAGKPTNEGNEGSRSRRPNAADSRKRRPVNTETILVTGPEGKSFADVLKDVRNTVTMLEGESVLAITKERDSAKIVIKKGEGADRIARVIQEAHPQLKAKQKLPSTLILIRGLDFEVSREEIVGAVDKAAGEIGARVRGGLRTTSGDMKTATVEVPQHVADKILGLKRIRVGPVMAAVVLCKTRQVERCYRCWATGHIARDCRGPDRMHDCYKCGKGGHKAAQCTNEQNCADCEGKDHRTGSVQCKSSRAIGKVRSQNKQ